MQLSVVSCQLSDDINHYSLTTIHYPLSTIHYPRSTIRRAIGLVGGVLLSGAAMAGGDPTAVIAFDLTRLDAAGLQGPPDGLRALDYEFCIPQGRGFRDQVAAIDPSARFQSGSRGRIGCGPDQVLVLGNTHQDDYREVLLGLARLPYVKRIAEAFFE